VAEPQQHVLAGERQLTDQLGEHQVVRVLPGDVEEELGVVATGERAPDRVLEQLVAESPAELDHDRRASHGAGC
jgi:hypothetical protein